jgi:hypothetical protein
VCRTAAAHLCRAGLAEDLPEPGEIGSAADLVYLGGSSQRAGNLPVVLAAAFSVS